MDTKHIGQISLSAGQILLSSIDNKSDFKPSKTKDEGLTSELKEGTVLVVGGTYKNDLGVTFEAPCKVGDHVMYNHNYAAMELEREFIKYPVVTFKDILGVINAT